ncbi:MAG: GtrA family protein [Methylacidiphilales bacterium]|nr:GtrA family protein [Candidatus Methylacidiphilales bacterium]
MSLAVLKREFRMFVIVGIFSVSLDFIVYLWLYWHYNVSIHLAKIVGYIVGGIFSALANRMITFRTRKPRKYALLISPLIFVCLLFLNTIINNEAYQSLRHYIPIAFIALSFAFIISLAIGSLIKFILVRQLSYKK